MKYRISLLVFVLILLSGAASAVTINFFNSSQSATLVATGDTNDIISSSGYLFTYTRDKLYNGGNGRPINVPFSDGVAAQAITVDPFGKAEISISRVDGNIFDIPAFTIILRNNTLATGATIEVMPQLSGEDAYNDPVFFYASGFTGTTFSYDTGTKPQSTLLLKGFDNYKFTLFVDFALTGITLVDATPPNGNLLSQTQVSQLYVSIFGRASEGEGNAYWQSEQSDMTTAANTMLATGAAKAYFGDTLNNNQAFIEFIYNNTLGKTYADDPTGVNYWVNELSGGKSKGEVVATLINAAIDPQYIGLPAQNQFLNKVAVSNYTADTITTAPDVNDLSAFVNFISGVTDDSATVDSAKGLVDMEACINVGGYWHDNTCNGTPDPILNFDPVTTDTPDPILNFDPVTTDTPDPILNFDPVTTDTLDPILNFDPVTTDTLDPILNFDPVNLDP